LNLLIKLKIELERADDIETATEKNSLFSFLSKNFHTDFHSFFFMSLENEEKPLEKIFILFSDKEKLFPLWIVNFSDV